MARLDRHRFGCGHRADGFCGQRGVPGDQRGVRAERRGNTLGGDLLRGDLRQPDAGLRQIGRCDRASPRVLRGAGHRRAGVHGMRVGGELRVAVGSSRAARCCHCAGVELRTGAGGGAVRRVAAHVGVEPLRHVRCAGGHRGARHWRFGHTGNGVGRGVLVSFAGDVAGAAVDDAITGASACLSTAPAVQFSVRAADGGRPGAVVNHACAGERCHDCGVSRAVALGGRRYGRRFAGVVCAARAPRRGTGAACGGAAQSRAAGGESGQRDGQLYGVRHSAADAVLSGAHRRSQCSVDGVVVGDGHGGALCGFHGGAARGAPGARAATRSVRTAEDAAWHSGSTAVYGSVGSSCRSCCNIVCSRAGNA